MIFLWAILASLPVHAEELFPQAKSLPTYNNILHEPRTVRPYTPADVTALAAMQKRITAHKYNNNQVIYFLPDHFKLIFGEDSQKLIDDMTLKVFSSDAGKTLCKLAGTGLEGGHLIGDQQEGKVRGDIINDKALRLQVFLGISPAAAKKVLSLCGPVKLSASENEILWEMLNLTEGKEYLFVFPQNDNLLDGFTTKYNTTLFFVRPGTSSTELFRYFLHELAMSFDQLAKMAYETERDTWWEGLDAVFPNEGENFDRDKNAVHSNSPVKEVRCALRDPSIRYAAAAERAFRFEDRVLADLKIPSANAAVYGPCSESVIHWIPQLRRLNGAIAFELTSGVFERDCGHKVAGNSPRAHDIVQRLALLNQTEFTVAGHPEKLNLCQFLLSPHVGLKRFDLSSGGPRPRAGGWGDDREVEEHLQLLSDGQSLDANDLKKLDEFLKLPDLEQELSQRPPQ